MKIPGLSFSLKRAIGITALKHKVARKTGNQACLQLTYFELLSHRLQFNVKIVNIFRLGNLYILCHE